MSPRAPLLEALSGPEPLIAAELRPPGTGLGRAASMDAWIDLHHAARRFAGSGRFVFLTDAAVGLAEEENLAHLAANVPQGVERERLVPFLTCKHPLDHCLLYAQRAASLGFETLTVVGGDRGGGPPRCVPHAYLLRHRIRERVGTLTIGGWANPHADPILQAGYVASSDFSAEFVLTQVVSHYAPAALRTLIEALAARVAGPSPPVLAGVFHYRSARSQTLQRLARYFPVPARELTRDLDAGCPPEELTARSIRSALESGAHGVYVSNLGLRRAARTLKRILERV